MIIDDNSITLQKGAIRISFIRIEKFYGGNLEW